MHNRWRDDEARAAIDRWAPRFGETLAIRTYTSRLLGADPSLVLHGGGNTSAKGHVITHAGTPIEARADVLFIKGSGWDLATIEPQGHPAARLDPLRRLRALTSLTDDAMVAAQRSALIDPGAPNPSIECLLHAFLPHAFVDHTHADAVLAIADQRDAEKICRDLYGRGVVFVPYVMPGFSLAKTCADAFEAVGADVARVVVLGQHGVFTFGPDAKTSYDAMIDAVARAAAYVDGKRSRSASSPPTSGDPELARRVASIARGALRRVGGPSILAWDRSATARRFVDDAACRERSQRGPATPDHVIRTKPWPAIVEATAGDDATLRASIDGALARFADRYSRYVDAGVAARGPRKPLDRAPRVILVPGLGVLTVGKSVAEASVAREIYAHTIDVVEGASVVGKYNPVAPLDLFDLEYWPLEQAKLGKQGRRVDAPLEDRVAVVTGAASGIGLATARLFLERGAHVMLVDRDDATLAAAYILLEKSAPKRVARACADVTDAGAVARAFAACVDAFGGVDVVVSNAGTAPQGLLHTESGDAALATSIQINLLGHQHVARAASEIFLRQGVGGALLFNASKAAFNPGAGFGPYAVAKAATVALMRQYAIDLAPYAVRSNAINADRIRTALFGDGVLEARAKARGLSPDDYFKSNLLGREVTAEECAEAFLFLAGAASTTGCVVTVDGGNASAFPR
jgi:rhamnose utilization protein RhaD (predicted bifunctional aldolase and dehydrogenase)/NAD(P)-dependent dehydrogenase (short-subunit alcohol dehydrogenase family)